MSLQKYRCHKEVEAGKIVIIGGPPSAGAPSVLTFEDGNQVTVPDSYRQRHNPKIGGYYVRYKDGYESFSPAEAFEEGYTAIGEDPVEEETDEEEDSYL